MQQPPKRVCRMCQRVFRPRHPKDRCCSPRCANVLRERLELDRIERVAQQQGGNVTVWRDNEKPSMAMARFGGELERREVAARSRRFDCASMEVL